MGTTNMTPTFNVSNNLSNSSGEKRKKAKSDSSTTPKKGKKGNNIATILSPNTLEDAKTIIDLAEKDKSEELKESATTFATGIENNINLLVQTSKLVAKA